jgi:hypothetical protein
LSCSELDTRREQHKNKACSKITTLRKEIF